MQLIWDKTLLFTMYPTPTSTKALIEIVHPLSPPNTTTHASTCIKIEQKTAHIHVYLHHYSYTLLFYSSAVVLFLIFGCLKKKTEGKIPQEILPLTLPSSLFPTQSIPISMLSNFVYDYVCVLSHRPQLACYPCGETLKSYLLIYLYTNNSFLLYFYTDSHTGAPLRVFRSLRSFSTHKQPPSYYTHTLPSPTI